jgi:methyl-accepting chemotaxis protein
MQKFSIFIFWGFMIKYLNNLKIVNKLKILIIPIVLITFVSLFIIFSQSKSIYSKSEYLIQANKAYDYLLKANAYQAIERGTTATVLNNPLDRGTFEKISKLRNLGDLYLDSAITVINMLGEDRIYITDNLNQLKNLKEERDNLRSKLDRILTIQKDSAITVEWIKTQSNLIMGCNNVANSMFITEDNIENILKLNNTIKKNIFYASEYAGRERAELGAVISSGGQISENKLEKLMKYRGIVEANINEIVLLKNDPNISSETKSAIQNMQSIFLGDFENIRKSVYNSGLRGESYAITGNEWINKSTNAINSILSIADMVSKESQDLASAQKKSSTSSFIIVIVLTIIILIVVFLSFYIAKIIYMPINKLNQSAVMVANGNYNLISDAIYKDEIGSLSSSFNTMIKSIKKYNELLKEEKAGVEKKVELAVADAENKKKYLERKTDEMLNAMNKFSEGNLTVKLEIENNDEIGTLFNGFNKAVENFKNLILSIKAAVDTTASAAIEISSSTEQMTSGATESTNQTSEVVQSIEQMTLTIYETTKNVNTVATKTRNAEIIATDSQHAMLESIRGMNRIVEIVEDSSNIISDLGSSSTEIGEIIEVIEEIADQTNLLALNAAIEAARAGEQGRGFAVVADEVRKLAEKTTKATKEISEKIKDIQKDTMKAVASMKNGTTEAKNGKVVIEKAGDEFRNIVENTKEISDLINQVASGSEQLNISSDEIRKSINSISNATRESAGAIQQVAVAAEDLSNLTERLHSLIESFKVDSSKHLN